jgi:hypothetical protein
MIAHQLKECEMKIQKQRAFGRRIRRVLAKQVISDQQTKRVAIIDRQKGHIVSFRVEEKQLGRFFELLEAANMKSGGGIQFISALHSVYPIRLPE